MRIRGERGKGRIQYKETNEATGISWFVVYFVNNGFRHKYAKDLKLTTRKRGVTLA